MLGSMRALVANGYGRVGIALLGLVALTATIGPFVAPGDGSIISMLTSRDTGPSWSHPFGTTMMGNDIFSQVLNATPLTLEIVFGATALALGLAIAVGVAAGTFGGRTDTSLSAITNVFLTIPALPLAIVIAGVLPKGQHTALVTMVMVALGTWAAEARVLRAQALSLRNQDFVAAAAVAGESRWRIALHELVPNMASRIAAGFFFVAIQATILLATLDFLASLSRGRFALGDTNGATWGSLLASAQTGEALLTGSWWAFAFPALALLVTAAGLVLTMYGIEQLADPRLRGRTPVGRVSLRLPRLRRPELSSPAPAFRTLGAAAPHLGRHLLRRLPIYLLALWLSATVAFALPRLAWHGRLVAPPPTGPFWSGYGTFLRHLGFVGPGVVASVRATLPFSLALVGAGTVIAFTIGTVLGLFAAWRRGGTFDGAVTTATAVVWTVPTFALAGVALELLGVRWSLFPIQWAYGLDVVPSWTWGFVGSAFRHAELPLLVLVVASLGLWVLSMRTVTLGVANDDYIHFARAKGLSESRIMLRYAGRNALLPTITGFAVAFGLAIGGIPALEEVFSYSGGGWELQQAAITGNLPLVQALVVAIALSVVVVNLLVDVAQVLLDPRLRT
jgi:ABC-type dipeptide/oligopeptide/nickel transport system permease subunit